MWLLMKAKLIESHPDGTKLVDRKTITSVLESTNYGNIEQVMKHKLENDKLNTYWIRKSNEL